MFLSQRDGKEKVDVRLTNPISAVFLNPRILMSQLLILRQAYSAALRNYGDVLGKRTVAVVTGDHEMARQLIASLEEVAVSCTRAKTALQQHETAAHSKVRSAGA